MLLRRPPSTRYLSFRKRGLNIKGIAEDALGQFDPSKEFDAIVASRKTAWHQWIKGKIDDGDFQNRALKFEKEGHQEINLSDLKEHIKPD